MFIATMKKISIACLMALTLLISGCSTDFDINADWQDIAVVYALLDNSDTAQYVKLNRAFLGDADAYEMASIKDSIYYEQARVFLSPVQNGTPQTSQRIELSLTDEIQKDSGNFYYEENYLYKTTQAIIPGSAYFLEIQVPGKDPITSTTHVISGLHVTNPAAGPQIKVSFANFFGYTDYIGEVALNENGLLYGLTIRFNYLEYYQDSVVARSIDWVQSSKKKEYVAGSQSNFVEWSISGEEFYWFVGQRIAATEGILFRQFQSLDFVYSAAGEELVSYVETNGPSQGVVQEKPFYTNIINGVGLFSSRYTQIVGDKNLTDFSIDRLACDEQTKHLLFKNSAGEVNPCD